MNLTSAVAELPRAQAVEYLRRVLAHLFDLGAHSYVRLSASGRTPPDYRIEMVMDEETGQPQVFGEFSGKTHRELTARQSGAASWYDAVTPRSEVQTLIGTVRARTSH